jgi:hypothetical protein
MVLVPHSMRLIAISFCKWDGLVGDNTQRWALMSRKVQRNPIASSESTPANGSPVIQILNLVDDPLTMSATAQRLRPRPSSPASQPTAFDLSGSNGIASVLWRSHKHSNKRCSKPNGPAEVRSSCIRRWHRGHRGRSIAVKNCWVEPMILTSHSGGIITGLPVTDRCRACEADSEA